MLSVEEYMQLPYAVVLESDGESGYIASFPDLPGCISCGDTREDALQNAQDAQRSWLAAAIEDGIKIAKPGEAEKFSGQFKIRMPRSLHKSLVETSKREGVSMNQYCVHLLSYGIDRY